MDDHDIMAETLSDLVTSEIEKSAIPIAIERGDRRLDPHGTGTFLQIGDDFFIVTAAHVFREAHDAGSSLWAITNDYVPIHGHGACSLQTEFDVAVLHLDEDTGIKLSKTRPAVKLFDVSLQEELSNGIYCLYGFPAVMSKGMDVIATDRQPFQSTSFQVITSEFDGSTDQLSGFLPDVHFLLTAVNVTDAQGKSLIKPEAGPSIRFINSLHGMSGSSVWKIAEKGEQPGEWSAIRPRVIGVQSAVYPTTSAIKIVRWKYVCSLIERVFPEIGNVLPLYKDLFHT